MRVQPHRSRTVLTTGTQTRMNHVVLAFMAISTTCALLDSDSDVVRLGSTNDQTNLHAPGLAEGPPVGFSAVYWNNIPRMQSMSEAMTYMKSHRPAERMAISTLSFHSKKDVAWQGLDSSFKENFAASFTGCLLVKTKGTYRIWTKSNEGSVLWLNDKLLVDNTGTSSGGIRSAEVELPRGMQHVRVDYWQMQGEGSSLKAGWEGPGEADREFSAADVFQTSDGSCVDIQSVNAQYGGNEEGNEEGNEGTSEMHVKYPEEVMRAALVRQEDIRRLTSEPARKASEQAVLDVTHMAIRADGIQRELTEKSILKVRAEINTTTHPGLDMEQMAASNASDAMVMRETRIALNRAKEEMNTIVSNGSATPISVEGRPQEAQNVSHHVVLKNRNISSVAELDPVRDGTNAYNDGRKSEMVEDEVAIRLLANKNITQDMTLHGAGSPEAAEVVHSTDAQLGFQNYTGNEQGVDQTAQLDLFI